MKKIGAIILITIFLVGCGYSDSVNENSNVVQDLTLQTTHVNPQPLDDTNALLESTISASKSAMIHVDVTVQGEEGIETTHSFSHVELYPTFKSMVNSTEGEFKYLLLKSVSAFSDYSNQYMFEDTVSGEDVKVVFYKDTYEFKIDETYMIHVFTSSDYDYYFVSDVQHGIFEYKDNKIVCSTKFTDLYNKHVDNEEAFIKLFANDLLLKAGDAFYEEIERLENADTLTIMIVKEPMNQEAYKAELLKLGFDEDIYGNESVFQSEIVSQLPEDNKEARINAIRHDYKMARLQAIKNVTQTSQSQFLNDYDILMDDVIYCSTYTSTIVITVTKDALMTLIRDERVISISLYDPIEIDRNTKA